ncbi:hypothetical protein BDK51DRAFT_49929 [Blyttiomyces helicus]|uniref:[F-actin]-monooxygenase MICAL1-3-like Rossman domain-containing protein n=1 Tax=Blyttiomyces helicus TaxID=388810 RepID=A0A4P9WER1_9FUNG|nr:hypothetical protein BDK51DRAFT_49929 [Blyttiomyces helicus]|eukprot:RKO90203.1 hypothetical protein BDK51DRAFT_49929 [Blyttiomyces helicus]
MTQARFNAFMASTDVADTFQAFKDICTLDLPSEPQSPTSSFYETFKAAVAPRVIYRQKTLFAVLDRKLVAARAGRVVSTKPFEPKRFVVSGAGPCGLRAAVELAAIGHSVTVVELRKDFSRHNMIKTWRGTVMDLGTLGLGQYTGFAPHGMLHLETRVIQLVLLKTALLFGVRVSYDVGVCGLVDPAFHPTESNRFAAWTLPSVDARAACRCRSATAAPAADEPAELALKPSGVDDIEATGERRSKVDFIQRAVTADGAVLPRNGTLDPRATLLEFDGLMIAEGEASTLLRHLGFDRKYARFAEAIGMVVNLEFSPAVATAQRGVRSPELLLKEFVIGRTQAGWSKGILGDLDRAGVQIENVEYMRGLRTHFMVVTVKRASLLAAKVIKEDLGAIRDTLTASNVDLVELRRFARSIASSAGIPSDAPFCDRHGVQLFDFSSKAMTMQSTRTLESETGARAFVLPIGDAFQAPFWPQGLGVNRGFQTTLDAVHAAHTFFADSPDAALEERAFSRRTSEWMTLQDSHLRPPTAEEPWTCDPVSRYDIAIYKMIHKHDMADKNVLLSRAGFWKDRPAFDDSDGQAVAAARIPMPKRISEALGLVDTRGRAIVSPGA